MKQIKCFDTEWDVIQTSTLRRESTLSIAYQNYYTLTADNLQKFQLWKYFCISIMYSSKMLSWQKKYFFAKQNIFF